MSTERFAGEIRNSQIPNWRATFLTPIRYACEALGFVAVGGIVDIVDSESLNVCLMYSIMLL